MKKKLIISLLLFSPSVFAQEGKFTVSGKIDDLGSKTIRIYTNDKNGGRVVDSVKVTDGYFNYNGKVEGMESISFYPPNESVMKKVNRGFYPAKSSTFQFIAFPGANIKFSGKITDFVDAYPSGDPVNNDLGSLNKAVYPLMNESVNLAVKIGKNLITDSLAIKKAKEKIEKLDNEVVNIKTAFIKSHPSSAAAAWLLGDMMVRSQVKNEEAIGLYQKMDQQKLKTNPFYIEVVKRVEGLKTTTIGKPAPTINSMHTYNKKRFDLAALKGKYVVIDFWGTWCGPCVSGMPKMKEYLDKYKGKMEIVGVANESDNGNKWREFLDKNKDYHWHQVLNRNDEDYILKYSVAGFPTKIIVDPQGNIVGRYVGEDDSIYKRLDEIFK